MSSVHTGTLEGQAGAGGSALPGLLRCMRPAQWVKNGFVLIPLIFSAHLTDARLTIREAVAFAAFCMVASGIYLWNDCLDWKSDLEHPEKKMRPIPSGQLSASLAAACGSAFLVGGIGAGSR